MDETIQLQYARHRTFFGACVIETYGDSKRQCLVNRVYKTKKVGAKYFDVFLLVERWLWKTLQMIFNLKKASYYTRSCIPRPDIWRN